MQAEQKIHVSLIGALLLAVGALVLREAPEPQRAAGGSRSSQAAPPQEVVRAELESQIELLAERTARELPAATPDQLLLRFQALGRAGLDAAQPDQLARAHAAQPAALLSVLLEAGRPIESELLLQGTPRTLRELVVQTLDEPRAKGAELDPFQMDLLAFAVLAGLKQYESALADAAQLSLTELDRRARAVPARPGRELSPEVLTTLAAAWRAPSASAERARELQLSASMFRAVAVLRDPALEDQARRHLNALFFRYQVDRAVTRQLLAQAPDATVAEPIRVRALEVLGRLEQALYNAHVAFRSEGSSAPPPRLAAVMRQAARDAIDHLAALPGPRERASGSQRDLELERRRATVHVLRGLRTARVATS